MILIGRLVYYSAYWIQPIFYRTPRVYSTPLSLIRHQNKYSYCPTNLSWKRNVIRNKKSNKKHDSSACYNVRNICYNIRRDMRRCERYIGRRRCIGVGKSMLLDWMNNKNLCLIILSYTYSVQFESTFALSLTKQLSYDQHIYCCDTQQNCFIEFDERLLLSDCDAQS